MNMQKLYLLAVLVVLALIAVPAFSQDLPGEEVMPAYMKGGTITVTLKDGKSYTYSTDTHKVVIRGSKVKALPIAKSKPEEAPEVKKNRILVNVGRGYDGNKVKVTDSSVTVSDNAEPVVGMTYVRDLDNSTSVSGSVLTNGTVTLGVGKQF